MDKIFNDDSRERTRMARIWLVRVRGISAVRKKRNGRVACGSACERIQRLFRHTSLVGWGLWGDGKIQR